MGVASNSLITAFEIIIKLYGKRFSGKYNFVSNMDSYRGIYVFQRNIQHDKDLSIRSKRIRKKIYIEKFKKNHASITNKETKILKKRKTQI